MKYSIACCDDDREVLEQLRNFFATLSIQSENSYQVAYCSMGKEILQTYEEDSGRYDILILDLELRDCHGLKLAREIRRYDRDVLILFLTGYPQYMRESFKVQPFSFMEKPIQYHEFSQELERSIRYIEEDKDRFWMLHEKQEERVIRMREIMYVEKIKDTDMLRIVTDRGVFEVRENLSHIQDVLIRNCFISANRSCMINMKYFYKLDGCVIELRNGTQLVASRRKVDEIKKRILEYTALA